jgi:outer membrane immunogenic protein
MKQIILAGVALTLSVATPALAADLRMPVKAPPAVAAPVYNWSGFYLGAHCGGAWGRTKHTGDDGAYDEAGVESYSLSPDGLICGGQIGFNVQQGSWLWGVEAQGGYLGAKETILELASPDNINEVKYGGYAALTGRLGIVNNNWLFYGKGGAAFARVRNHAGDLVDGTGAIDPVDVVDVSKWRFGWAAGGGIEWGFASNWSVRAEYLFMHFGSHSAINAQGDTYTFRNQVHTATVGLNYRWGASPVARY